MTQRHRNSNEISKGISYETCAKRYTCKDREIIWLKSPRMVLICDDYKETEIDYDLDELVENVISVLKEIGLDFLQEEDRDDRTNTRILSFVYDGDIINVVIYGESDRRFMVLYAYSESVNGKRATAENETFGYTVAGIPVDDMTRLDKSFRTFSKMIKLYREEDKAEKQSENNI